MSIYAEKMRTSLKCAKYAAIARSHKTDTVTLLFAWASVRVVTVLRSFRCTWCERELRAAQACWPGTTIASAVSAWRRTEPPWLPGPGTPCSRSGTDRPTGQSQRSTDDDVTAMTSHFSHGLPATRESRFVHGTRTELTQLSRPSYATRSLVSVTTIYIKRSDVIQSMVTIRSSFCGYNTV